MGRGLVTAEDGEKRKMTYGSTALYSRLGRCRDRPLDPPCVELRWELPALPLAKAGSARVQKVAGSSFRIIEPSLTGLDELGLLH
jgi:hypothetical protein